MNNKFIRVISPITVAVVGCLDLAIIALGVFAIKKIQQSLDGWTIAFLVIELFAIVIGVITSKEAVSNGVRFDESKMEFTGLDDNNIFEYAEIEKIETSKDTKASLRKNFVDRYSSIIIYKKDNSVTTIELGLTTRKTLLKIEKEINSRI